jgi:DNA-binding XRE family transcriptional regulator
MSDTATGGRIAAGSTATASVSSSAAGLSLFLPSPDDPPRGQPKLPPATVIDGSLLREARLRRGLSREHLAWNAGIAITTVSRLERQKLSPCRPRSVFLLARALGEHPVALIPPQEAVALRLAPADQPGAGEHDSTDDPAALSA